MHAWFSEFYKAFMGIKYNRTKEPVSFEASRSYGNTGSKTWVSAYALL